MNAGPAVAAAAAAPVAAAASGSLFNKNFLLGAVAGLVAGAFIVPMAIDFFNGKAEPIQAQALSPAQVQAQTLDPSLTTLDPNASISAEKGDAFLDTAIKAVKP